MGLALLLHGSGIDDVIVVGAAVYLTVMFIISRVKAGRHKRAKAQRKLARAQAQIAASAQADPPASPAQPTPPDSVSNL